MADRGFAIEPEREEDGRWIAEVPSLPGGAVSEVDSGGGA
jgi:hypothetical protein